MKNVMAKEDRYGWYKDLNDRGHFLYIDKNKLSVDHENYQRNLNDAKRKAIAAGWRWPACGTLSVVQRPDGSYWVFDGQHRLAAALTRSDIDTLPCLVFRGIPGGLSGEAEAFLNQNKLRKSLTGIECFKAQLTSGDPIAQEMLQLVAQSNRVIADHSSPSTVQCVQALYRLLQTDPAATRSVWPIVVELSVGHPLYDRLLCTLAYIERNLRTEGGDLVRLSESPALIDSLRNAGVPELRKKMAAAGAFYAKAGVKIWAQGILTVINHKRRNRYALPGGEA